MSAVNILVVDDRPEGLMAVEAVLKSPQYNIVTASSGNEALKKLLSQDFAVILMDVQMPVMNGFETAAVIKTREKSKDVPIIFMSAINQDEQYVYQGYGVGAVDYLLKPFDPYILQSKVAIFANLYRLNQKIKEQAQRIHENDIKIYTQAMDRLELESLRKYQNLADSIPQIVFRVLPDGNASYFNKVWFEYTGLSPEDSMNDRWRDAIHPEDLLELVNRLSSETSEGLEFEVRIRNRDQQMRWHLVRLEPENYSDTQLMKTWLGTATDIEERKNEELRQRFLAEAGELLVSSLDFLTNMEAVAQLAVPILADGLTIDIVEPVKEFSTGDTSGQHSITVPLFAHGSTIGILHLHYHSLQRRSDPRLEAMGAELGHRISMAHENARHFLAAKEAIEIRNDFLSIASHELNTPITSLKLQLQMVLKGLELARDGKLPMERFQTSVRSSVRQVDRLIQLIQVLLDVSRIQSGKFTFLFRDVAVDDLIRDVVERHQEMLTSSECHVEIGDLPSVKATWDKTRIEQVITNLMMNAIKYAPGKIELKAEVHGGEVRIEMRDHGPGIEADKLSTIFNRFERAATSDKVGGLGLGLFIVKEIVEGHQGRIDVSTELGKGSSFVVTLPLHPQPSPNLGHQTYAENQPAF